MKRFVQKVYLLHDCLYSSRDLIPKNYFDGKDSVKEVYVVTDTLITEANASDYFWYRTEIEAVRTLN
ncbi:hypothetical protein [Brevibacillus sp. SYSU BS000544]|uniref:hypothetical protein n=1 Tax=Brevibacillus sp. SYSU BS000544 TaxID=3416443 RepID=UPI003CE4DCD8